MTDTSHMKQFDVKLPVTLTIRVAGHSAADAAFYLHEAFKAVNGHDPLEGAKFLYKAFGLDLDHAVWTGEIKTCVADVPVEEIEVEEV